MYARTVKVINKTGLHARPASQFISEAKKFKSKICIKKIDTNAEPINAKSIVLLLSMSIACGSEVRIKAEGEDEVQAVDALVQLIESGFEE